MKEIMANKKYSTLLIVHISMVPWLIDEIQEWTPKIQEWILKILFRVLN